MYNKVTLIGRLGKDPEVKTLSTGATVANFSMATTESYKDKNGEKKETTEWHNIVIWNKLADIVKQYVHKGDLIMIEGKITTRSWEKDGVTRYSTEIVAHEMKMLGSKGGNSNSAYPASSMRSAEGNKPSEDKVSVDDMSDLPF
jgi:single-strand DNA-binding protein